MANSQSVWQSSLPRSAGLALLSGSPLGKSASGSIGGTYHKGLANGLGMSCFMKPSVAPEVTQATPMQHADQLESEAEEEGECTDEKRMSIAVSFIAPHAQKFETDKPCAEMAFGRRRCAFVLCRAVR